MEDADRLGRVFEREITAGAGRTPCLKWRSAQVILKARPWRAECDIVKFGRCSRRQGDPTCRLSGAEVDRKRHGRAREIARMGIRRIRDRHRNVRESLEHDKERINADVQIQSGLVFQPPELNCAAGKNDSLRANDQAAARTRTATSRWSAAPRRRRTWSSALSWTLAFGGTKRPGWAATARARWSWALALRWSAAPAERATARFTRSRALARSQRL